MTKGQEEFLDQMTRKLLVGWGYDAILNETVTFVQGDGNKDPFIQHAVAKKWISPVSNTQHDYTYKILSGGWDTATRFLKR
jgi:hypothetical protein